MILGKLNLEFNVNWLEYLILKRIFTKRKYKITKQSKIKGQKIEYIVIDEISNVILPKNIKFIEPIVKKGKGKCYLGELK